MGISLKPKEVIVMSNLYLDKEYPYNFLTLEEVKNILGVSKATAINVTKGLIEKGYIKKNKSFISFYYPINNINLRRDLLEYLGFFGKKC